MGQIGIDYQAFNNHDEEAHKGRCRLCGKLATGRFWHYCSKEHRDLFEMGVSWSHARYLVLERDNYTCVKCGKIVAPHYHTYNEKTEKFVYSEEIANVHHVIPVAYLWDEVLRALDGCPEENRRLRQEQLKAIVFFHIDNLVTLCEDPCHKEEHKSGWYKKFEMMQTGQTTLSSQF